MKNNYGDVKFLHFADAQREVPFDGGATIAYRINGDTITYAVAYCSAADKFSKQYGRAKALGRLRQGTHISSTVGTVASLSDMMYDIGYIPRRMNVPTFEEEPDYGEDYYMDIAASRIL